jgi:O-antigen/teichoic acid export membrane protein
MLNDYFGLGTVGVYTICFFFGVIISLPARPITRIANIIAAQAWKNNDIEALKQLYYKSCMTLFIIGSILFLGLWANIDNVFRMLPEEYSAGGEGKWVIFFIALGSLIDMSTGVNGSIMGSSRYYRVQTYFLISLVLLIIATNLILIPLLGMKGVALGNAISMTILNILRFGFLKYKFGFQPFNKNFLYVIITGGAVLFLANLIPPFQNYIIDILVRGSLVVTMFCLPVYFMKLSVDINEKVNKVISRISPKH